VTAIPLGVGAVALWHTAAVAGKMPRARVAPGAFPPAPRLEGIALATRQPALSSGPAPRWSRDDVGAALLQWRAWPMRRSRLWRMREAAALTPHRRVYWRNSHAPDVAAPAHNRCSVYLSARRVLEQGRWGIGSDAKTGMHMLERHDPPRPLAPSKPANRAHAYLRQGTRGLIASFVVPTGQVVWPLGQTRSSSDCAAPLAPVGTQLPERPRSDWGGIPSTPPGVLRAAVWVPSGARCPWWPRPGAEVGRAGRCGTTHAIGLASTVRSNTAPGFTRWRAGVAHDPNAVRGPFIHPGPTSEPLHDWQRTYEMDI
jgi:hypothetical protein